jgi:hypothetical protein
VSQFSARVGLVGFLLVLFIPSTFAQQPDPPQPPAEAPPPAQDPANTPNAAPPPAANQDKLPGPKPIQEVQLGPTLRTKPVPQRPPGPNWLVVDPTPLPKDRDNIWILDFAFKPLRMIDIELPGKGRRKIHYLYYRVINHSGQPVRFVPQFTLVTDSGKRYDDVVLPQAIPLIQNREDPTTPLAGSITSTGTLMPSTKQGVDDAFFGVAVWDNVDFRADAFKIYVRGLSDGYQIVKSPDGKEITRFKALRIDFARPGDEFNPTEREIRLLEPPFEWVYYP